MQRQVDANHWTRQFRGHLQRKLLPRLWNLVAVVVGRAGRRLWMSHAEVNEV
eukprot:SAG31_NODE_422_length_15859_cov_5.161865_11_plen_52_part_00